jgi:2-oxoglutarate dehydrogenase complex dehydrogenase (E1) component-like enzyme
VIKNLGIDSQVNYVGRKAISATAVGSVEMHKKETAELSEWIK